MGFMARLRWYGALIVICAAAEHSIHLRYSPDSPLTGPGRCCMINALTAKGMPKGVIVEVGQ